MSIKNKMLVLFTGLVMVGLFLDAETKESQATEIERTGISMSGGGVVKPVEGKKASTEGHSKNKSLQNFNKLVKNGKDAAAYKQQLPEKLTQVDAYYAQKNKEHGNKEHWITATVTMTDARTETDLKQMINQYGIKAESVDLTYRVNGQLTNQKLFWSAEFDHMDRTLQQRIEEPIEIVGYTAIYGSVELEKIKGIAKLPTVVVDVSADVSLTNVTQGSMVPSLYKYLNDVTQEGAVHE